MAKTSNILYPIYVREKSASVDAKFGPYNSVQEAIFALNKLNALTEGLEIGIRRDGVTTRFYFKGGTTAAHLVPMDGSANGGSAEIEQCKCNLIDRGYTDEADGVLKLVLVKKDGSKIEVEIPKATKASSGVMLPSMIELMETAISRSASALTAANTAATLTSKAEGTVSEVKELLAKFAEEGSGADNIAAQVIQNTTKIAQLEDAIGGGGSGTGSSVVEKGTYKQAYVKAQNNDAPFVWILDDTINDTPIRKPIWHVGNKVFVDAIGAVIEGNIVKPVVTIDPPSGLKDYPLTVTASVEPADAVVYMNGEATNTLVLDEPGSVYAYAEYDGVIGDVVSVTYTGNNTSTFFADGQLGNKVSLSKVDTNVKYPATVNNGLIKIPNGTQAETATYISGVYAKNGQTGNVKIEYKFAYSNEDTKFVSFRLYNSSNVAIGAEVKVLAKQFIGSDYNIITLPSVACTTNTFKIKMVAHYKASTIRSIIVEH